jgi:hypothetical protein
MVKKLPENSKKTHGYALLVILARITFDQIYLVALNPWFNRKCRCGPHHDLRVIVTHPEGGQTSTVVLLNIIVMFSLFVRRSFPDTGPLCLNVVLFRLCCCLVDLTLWSAPLIISLILILFFLFGIFGPNWTFCPDLGFCPTHYTLIHLFLAGTLHALILLA